MAKHLISVGVDVNEQKKRIDLVKYRRQYRRYPMGTPLRLAIGYNAHLNLARLFLKHGARADLQDDTGKTLWDDVKDELRNPVIEFLDPVGWKTVVLEALGMNEEKLKERLDGTARRR